jgi:hypothetical protein
VSVGLRGGREVRVDHSIGEALFNHAAVLRRCRIRAGSRANLKEMKEGITQRAKGQERVGCTEVTEKRE